jgi:UDPglucose--hexose-1-phosphate uridylyltransferase
MSINKNKQLKNISELRQDLVSEDWVIIATARNKRPNEMITKKEPREIMPIEKCPFEDLEKSDNGPALMEEKIPGTDEPLVKIISNKFPALDSHRLSIKKQEIGPYRKMNGYGRHEVVILKDHFKQLSDFSHLEMTTLLVALRRRYREIAKDKKIKYISIFHNLGPLAGASLFHPHLQIIATPAVSSTIKQAVIGSEHYWKKHRKCPHCEIINFELKEKKRVIFENDKAVVITPFASREPFELKIYPKNHSSYFEDCGDEMNAMAEALCFSLKLLKNKLSDPDLNFFIHTAPVYKKEKFSHFHWHIEIIPRICISAGFEIGTGVEITPMDPDEGAEFLKS